MAIAAAVAATIVVAVLVRRPSPPVMPAPSTRAIAVAPVEPWDHAHRADLLRLKADADDRAVAGDLRGAYAGYQHLRATAAEHDVTDPVAVQTVADARAAQARVFAALVAPPKVQTTTQPAPPPADGARLNELSQMLAVADRLAAAGDLTGGWLAYQRVLDAAGPLSADPAVADLAAVTRRSQGMVESRIRQISGKSPVAPRSVVPPGPATPPPTSDQVRDAADSAPPVAAPPPSPTLRTYTPATAVTDEQIGRAIDRAITYLRTQRSMTARLNRQIARRRGVGGAAANDDDRPPVLTAAAPLLPDMDVPAGVPDAFVDQQVGETVLALYAVLNAGRATEQRGLGVRDPAVVAALRQLKAYPLGRTYTRSLRASTLAVFNRIEDRQALEEDVAWLIRSAHNGGYSYTPEMGRMTFDNSNSQYGLLGVWAGAQSGLAIPDDYWRAVTQHWASSVTAEGQWAYVGSWQPSETMTLAGVTSLLVTHEYLDGAAEAAGHGRPATLVPALSAGLRWLEQGDHAVPQQWVVGYGNYALERVGLASGFKRFGAHDWYAEGAASLVTRQSRTGDWGGTVNTAFDLLFLARGRHPLLFNKLRYDGGHWDDRPHDVANLARFAGQQLERPLNWQVVDVRSPWADWMDAPVLYVSGDAAPDLTDADYAALAAYANAGGLIFTHADNGSAPFDAWVKRMVRKCFPKYELTRVPADHPLNTVLFHLKKPPPQLEAVTNGSRLLLVHTPRDVAGGWTSAGPRGGSGDQQLGTNLFVYAGGKTNYRNRLDSTYVPDPPDQPTATVAVARLRYAGEWDPEPYGWPRFARAFAWDAHVALDVQAVDLKDLRPGQVPAAFLTGTFRQDFTPAEAAAVRAYVAAGGVLVVDACGGAEPFANSARALLSAAFPDAVLAPLPADHPVLLPARPFADDLRKMKLRPFAVDRLNTTTVPVEGLHAGHGWVLFSRLDLTSGLLGTQEWGIVGYDPAYAAALVKNAVLWADARSGGRRP